MGTELSIDERVRLWYEVNTPPGEQIEPAYECPMETVAKFLCPSEKTPIARATILAQIDLDFLEPVLLGYYSKTPHYSPLAMFRGVIHGKSGGIPWRALPRYLHAYPDQARLLGFINEDGGLEIPSYEHFRMFSQSRVDWDEIRDMIVLEVSKNANNQGIAFAEQVTEDATMVETIEGDPDGKYNGHYEKTGLKEDIVTCRVTGLPVMNETIGGTECEGHTLIGKLEHLRGIGIRVHDAWVDGTYATLENIAVAHTLFGTTLHYQIQESWVIREDGTPEYLKMLYQGFWKDPEFRISANLNAMMNLLVRKGVILVERGRELQQMALSMGAWGKKVRSKRGRPSKAERSSQEHFIEGERLIASGLRLLEPVGAYHRNLIMEKALKNPEATKKDKGKRQIAETMNDHLKNDLGLQESLHVKGMKKVHIHITMGCAFLLLVALHKLRHGVTKNLASLVGIE